MTFITGSWIAYINVTTFNIQQIFILQCSKTMSRKLL